MFPTSANPFASFNFSDAELYQALEQRAFPSLLDKSQPAPEEAQAAPPEEPKVTSQVVEEEPNDSLLRFSNEVLFEIVDLLSESQQGIFSITCSRINALAQAVHCRNHREQLKGPLVAMGACFKTVVLQLSSTTTPGQTYRFYKFGSRMREVIESSDCCAIERMLRSGIQFLDSQGSRMRGTKWDHCAKELKNDENREFLLMLSSIAGLSSGHGGAFHLGPYLQGKYRPIVLQAVYRGPYEELEHFRVPGADYSDSTETPQQKAKRQLERRDSLLKGLVSSWLQQFDTSARVYEMTDADFDDATKIALKISNHKQEWALNEIEEKRKQKRAVVAIENKKRQADASQTDRK